MKNIESYLNEVVGTGVLADWAVAYVTKNECRIVVTDDITTGDYLISVTISKGIAKVKSCEGYPLCIDELAAISKLANEISLLQCLADA